MSKQVSVEFKDWDRVVLGLDEFSRNNVAFRQEVLMQLGSLLVTLIVRRAPVNTGAYARSWRITNLTPNEVIVSTNIDPKLFVILEFSGAKAHVERPRVKSVMRFVIAGQELFATIVDHPGSAARPHVRPAVRELASRAEGIIYAVTTRHFPTLLKRASAKAARAHGYTGKIPPKQVGRSRTDVTANIGRGTKGKISAQLTSRKTGRKRIRIRGLRRVGTAEKQKAGSKVGGVKSRSAEQSV